MNSTEVRQCVLYARLSVTKEESVSIPRQLQSCRRYAEARGWEIAGEFVDDGVSATASRPEERNGWKALLATQGYDAVVIWKVDRLARRVLDFLHADQALQERGVGLVAVEDPIDMTSPQGRAFAVMLAVFGEMEAEAIRARVRAAREQIIKDGRWPGGGIPYGYKSIPNPNGPGRVLAKDNDRIDWLSGAVLRVLRGETVNSVARWLTNSGAPLPSRREERASGSVSWNRQTVDGLLRNPIIAGMTPYNPGRAKGAKRADPFAVLRNEDGLPVINDTIAIISYEDFERLQRHLDTRKAPQAKKRSERQSTSSFLSRVIRCDECGVFLCRGTNQKRPVLYCPKCRQTIGRMALDTYLIDRLLSERSDVLVDGLRVEEAWVRAGHNDEARRAVLISQLNTLVIRRGVVGRYFDEDRVLLTWL